jgi:hypothetical protein|uniref:Uncharacterized protein n=1 Tax=viral metagenome TaxID=1070528 RepID=A0A6C0BI11_9ZZZZ
MNSTNTLTKASTTTTSTNTFSYNRILLKAKYSFYSALVFFLFANPESYAILQRAFGHSMHIITSGGGPTIYGIFISTFLFFITMLGLMLLPNE